MDIGQLCSILEACLSPNQQQRAAAEQTLLQFQHAKGQLVNLLRVAVEPSVSQEVRQFAAISFKNLVKQSWSPSEGPSPIPEEDKNSVRENLLEGLVRSPPIIRSQLGECLKAIAYVDFPEKWPQLVPLIVQNLATQDHGRLFGCFLALRLLARKYEFRDQQDKQPLEELTQVTLGPVLQIVEQLLASNSASLEVAELLKLAFKIFYSATWSSIPPAVLEQFRPWMSVFHAIISRPVPQEGQPEDPSERKLWPWWKAQKWALSIVTRMFTKYAHPKHHAKGSPEQRFAELWREHCTHQFLQDQMALASRIAQGEYVSPRVVTLVLRFLEEAIQTKATWKLIEPHISTLLADCVFDLLTFDDGDAELWNDDPHEYIRKGYDVLEDLYSTKNAAANLVHEVCKVRAKSSLEGFMQLIVRVMTEYQSASVPTEKQARRVDGAFLAIGTLHDVLKSKDPYRKQLEAMLLQYVVPAFSSPYGHLRAKACWVTGGYADIQFREGSGHGSSFLALFSHVVKALQDPDLPVRVDAVVALRQLVDAYDEDHVDEIKPLIPSLLDQLFRLMVEVDNEDLVFTLETIVEKFGEEMAPYALGLCQHLTQAFWRLQSASPEEERDEEENGLAAFACLRALSTVLESVSSLPHLFPTLEPIVLPVIKHLCSHDGEDVFEENMEILSYFTYFSPEISAQLWEVWPMLYQALNEWAFDYFENILVPLDNFISRGTEKFLGSQNPNYLNQAIHMAEKVLTDSDASEGDVICAPKLLEIMLQNCKGRIDQCLPHFINLVLTRLNTAKRRNLQDQLILVVANAIYYNPVLAMQVLQQQGHLTKALPLWFQMIFELRKDGRRKHFRRQHDKKVCALALTALLNAPDNALPGELKAGMGQITSGCLKLLQDLKKQQDDFATQESDDEQSEEDDSGGDESEAGDDNDEETAAEDDAYMKRLAREAAKLSGQEVEDDSDAEWTDDEEDSTPLDDIDPYISFADTLTGLQAQHPERFQVCTGGLDDGNKAVFTGIMSFAQEQRQKAAAKSS